MKIDPKQVANGKIITIGDNQYRIEIRGKDIVLVSLSMVRHMEIEFVVTK